MTFSSTDGLGETEFTTLWHVEGIDSSLQAIYGPHHISDSVLEEISINILNTGPEIVSPGVLSIERSSDNSVYLLEVAISDYDGISVAQANLGVFRPFTSQSTWQRMYDDGTNGDVVAYDGIYTVEMQVRNSIPLGTHEILIQASDIYGELSPVTSVAVQLDQEQTTLPGVGGQMLTSGVLVGILALFGIGVGVVVFISIRNRPENEQGQDRFGFN